MDITPPYVRAAEREEGTEEDKRRWKRERNLCATASVNKYIGMLKQTDATRLEKKMLACGAGGGRVTEQRTRN